LFGCYVLRRTETAGVCVVNTQIGRRRRLVGWRAVLAGRIGCDANIKIAGSAVRVLIIDCILIIVIGRTAA